MGIVEEVFKTEDGLVRKVVVKTIRDGKPTLYTRHIYSTPKETHHLYAFTVVKKFNWR